MFAVSSRKMDIHGDFLRGVGHREVEDEEEEGEEEEEEDDDEGV